MTTNATPSVFTENSPFKAIEFDQKELQFVYDQHGDEAEEALAKTTSAFLNEMPEFRGTADYGELLQGTAPILDLVPMQPEDRGKAVTDDQILRLFSSLKGLGEDGAPTETDAFLRGLIRGGGSFATGVAGAKTAATLAPPYVPLPGVAAPLGTLSKPAAGLFGFLGGSIVGDAFIGTPVANMLTPGLDDVTLTPRAEATFRAYESAGSVAPFIFMPHTAPKAAFSTISSLRKLPLANQVTVLSADDMANPLVTNYLSGRISGIPTSTQFRATRDQIFREAKEAGQDITLEQAAKTAAQQLNQSGRMARGTIGAFDYAERALVAGGQSFRALSPGQKTFFMGVETAAIPATGLAVQAQETAAPRSPSARLAAETAGSLAPQLSLLKIAPAILKSASGFRKRIRENKALKQPLDIFGTRARAGNRATQDILDVFEQNRENPDDLLKALEEKLVDPVIKDGEIVGYKLKPDFQPKPGDEKEAIFSGKFVNSAAIDQLEQIVLGRGGPNLSAKQEADFLKSLEMEKGIIFGMQGSGDPQLMKIAGDMMQQRVSMLIAMRTERAINNVVKSVQKIYPEGGAEASALIGARLKNVITTQKDLFRRLEANAWSKVDRNAEIPTFYRKDDETGDFVENSIPNFIEEFDAELARMDKLDRDFLLNVPGFKEINARILDYKQQLGLDATDVLATKPDAVIKFDEAFLNTQGTPGRQSFLNILERNGIIGTTTTSRVNQLSGEVSEGALESFNQRIRLSEARPGSGLDVNSAENLRTAADSTEALANRQLALFEQDRAAGASFKENADALREEANLFRARADDIENPVETNVPTTLDDLVADEATIEQLGALESRFGRKNKNDPVVQLIRLKRQALIAQRVQAQGGDATGVVSENLTQGNLTSLYAKLRKLQREQGPTDANTARILNNLAEATLDDLNAGARGNPEYDAARDISYAYNEYLKRAFGGDIISKNRRGQDVVNEALLTDKLMTGRPDAVSLKVGQINELGKQIRRYAADSGYEIVKKDEVSDYMGTTESVLLDTLRLALREIELPIEAKTLRTDEAIAAAQNEAMQQFRAKNPQIMEIFPQLSDMMDEAGSAGAFLARVKDTTKRLEKDVAAQKAFVKLTKAENPEQAILAAINSDNPTKELNSLVELIKAGSNPRNLRRLLRNKGLSGDFETLDIEKARQGVRKTVMSLAFSNGGQYSVAGLNAKGAYNMLFEALPKASRESENLANWMVSNKIMTDEEVKGLEIGLRRLVQFETKQDVSRAIISNEAPALLDFYTRIIGARAGTTFSGIIPGSRGAGAGLIEAEAGSKFMRKLTQELPALQEYDALERILLDPQLLAMALRNPRSASEKTSIVNNIINGLKTVGIGASVPAGSRVIPLGAQEFVEPEQESIVLPEPEQPPLTESVLDSTQNTSFLVPAQRVEPPTTTLASAAPPVQAAPPAASGPVNRQQYAALFPNDSASAMIRQQGIGSLMG